ncbi:MAG: hypothetical protein H8D94_00590 [Candidatus Pelagibacter sp.]|nr:hypothetical protein [Candidatus Pelagibacter sp.]
MSDYINNALLNANPAKKQKEETKALVGKWDKTGLLDGLNEDFEKGGMAVLLENQARQLISENSGVGGRASGASAGAGSEEWSGVALPLVRRIFGEIAAQEFVSVQPMNLPSGLVFYLDFKYGKTTGQGEGFGTNNAVSVPGGDVNSLAGKTGPNSPSGSSAPYGVGGLYGEGRYDYTINTAETAGLKMSVDAILTTGEFITSSVTYKDINFNQEFSASLSAAELYKIETLASDLSDADLKAVRSFNISESAGVTPNTAIHSLLPQFTTYGGTNVVFIVSGSTSLTFNPGPHSETNFSSCSAIYSKQPTESDRGDFEDTVGDAASDTLAIPEVDLQLRSQAIVAKTRKLKAVWTPELAQDLNAYHSVDAESELTSMLSEYISMEIDLEILDMLIQDAVTTDYWSVTPGEDYNGTGTNEAAWNKTTFYGTRFEWWQTLVGKIQKMSNEIHRLTLRGGANFVVCSPKVSTILESLPGYNSSAGANAQQYAMGVTKIGAVDGRFQVYKNPYMTENQILVGFRGSNFLETGAVYAPYVPLIMTPLVYDPSDFTPRKGVMTRYAKKMIRPEFYGTIAIKDLNLV